MKEINQISFIIGLALLISCSGGKQSETLSERSERSDFNPYVIDSIAYERWGDPSSPYRDEERYMRFLRSFLSRDSLPESLRLRAENRLRIASLNRPGTIANDFDFIDRNGRKGSLYNLPEKNILLIFYDPECPHCSPILDYLAANDRINRAIENDSTEVVAIYTEGKRTVWDRSKADMPDNWTVGYDLSGIVENEIYNIPAMPIIYFLAPDKRVILKDPNPYTL